MSKSISLILVLLGASPVAIALDPVINKATAIELVHDALVSLGEVGAGTDVAIYPITDYYAPDFITLQAEVPHPREGWTGMKYYSVNPWTGDVWDADCNRITSPTIQRKQDQIWKSSKLPDEARHVLQARAPACTAAKPEPREKKK
jgi:hypothetical protein